MSSNDNSDPYKNHDRLTFESIAASIWKVLMRIQHAQLTGSRLATSFFLYQASPRSSRRCMNSLCSEILAGYGDIEEEAANMFLLERQRHGLLSAIGALDFFLSDMLRFLFLYRPSLIPPKAGVKKPAESTVDHVERTVRYGEFSKWRTRLNFLISEFGIPLEQALIKELARLVERRNEIVHHGSLYRFSIDEMNSQVWAEATPVPEVSLEDAQHSLMIVAEISDAILVAVCRSLFAEEPRVRILTPEVAAVHEHLRSQWAAKRNAPPEIEEIVQPGWAFKKSADGSMSWVGDINDDFLIRPTDLEGLPLILTLRRHTRHEAKAYATVDSNPRIELGMLHRRDLVEQLLTGRSLFVEFYEDPWPEPRYARYSLAGFGVAWEDACRRRLRLRPRCWRQERPTRS